MSKDSISEVNTYFSIGHQLGLNEEKNEFDNLIKELTNDQNALEAKNNELKNALSETVKELKALSIELINSINLIDNKIEDAQKKFIETNDNLLITHFQNWKDENSSRHISFNLLPSILLIIIGLFSIITAILIPDSTISSLLGLSSSSNWLSTEIIYSLKALIFIGVGGVIYLVLVKFIASKRFGGSGINYYSIFLLCSIFLWVTFISIKYFELADAILLFIGLNAFSLLPIGLSIVSFYYGKIQSLRRLKKKMHIQSKNIDNSLAKVEKYNLIDPLEIPISYKAFLENKKDLRFGFFNGKAENKRILGDEKRRKEISERQNKIRSDLGI